MDGYDEWGEINYTHEIMKNYYKEHPTYNGEADNAIDFEHKVKKVFDSNYDDWTCGGY